MTNEETAKSILLEVADTTNLNLAIKRLEARRFLQEEELKADFHLLLNDLKPINLLKTTLQEVQESTPLKHNLLKIAVGLGAGYFSRKMVIGKSAGIVKNALGTALQYGITSLIAKKKDAGVEGYPQGKKRGLLKRLLATKL